MIYKLVTKRKTYYSDDNNIPINDSVKISIPKKFKKSNFWLWLFNPNVKIYIYKNYNWVLVFNSLYRNIIK